MIANIVVLLGLGALIIIWLTIGKRKLSNFFICAAGATGIALCARSDREPSTMIGILIAVTIVSILLWTIIIAVKAHRAGQRRVAEYLPGQRVVARKK